MEWLIRKWFECNCFESYQRSQSGAITPHKNECWTTDGVSGGVHIIWMAMKVLTLHVQGAGCLRVGVD